MPSSQASGRRRASEAGETGPGVSSRHTAAQKQKAPNAISAEPVRAPNQAGSILASSTRAPTPLARAARPVRTQAA